MTTLRGNETPQEVIVIAYGMEQGLADFYSRALGMTGDQEVKKLIERLRQLEENHKDRLFGLYQSLEPATAGKSAL